MSDDLDKRVGQALKAIPEDVDAPVRLVSHLAAVRHPLPGRWMIGGAVLAGLAGFAVAFLQGPVAVSVPDAALFFLGGAI